MVLRWAKRPAGRAGETRPAVRLRLKNGTDKPLSLHWHGVRNVNAMDGVGGVTQEPVPPGGDFLYDFTPPDAGTFLIRPLVVGGSSEPSGRGLAGLLVVEEANPPPSMPISACCCKIGGSTPTIALCRSDRWPSPPPAVGSATW